MIIVPVVPELTSSVTIPGALFWYHPQYSDLQKLAHTDTLRGEHGYTKLYENIDHDTHWIHRNWPHVVFNVYAGDIVRGTSTSAWTKFYDCNGHVQSSMSNTFVLFNVWVMPDCDGWTVWRLWIEKEFSLARTLFDITLKSLYIK